MPKTLVHGKYTTYSNHGCRCRECKAAQNERQKAYMATHPLQRAAARRRQADHSARPRHVAIRLADPHYKWRHWPRISLGGAWRLSYAIDDIGSRGMMPDSEPLAEERRSTMKTIRIDMLPPEVQQQIVSLRAKYVGGSGIVTVQQLERATSALANSQLPTGKDWEASNSAVALGRILLRYFGEYPEQKRQFVNYLNRLKQSGIAVNRPGGRKKNGHANGE